MEYITQLFTDVSDDWLDAAEFLEQQIFDPPYPREKLLRETEARRNLCVLITVADKQPCGFKIGYEMTSSLYYSWIGGVAPEHRGKGVARNLMTKQHEFARNLGYRTVRTHTENRFREMLLLNIKFGFDVVGVCRRENEDRTVVMLEKKVIGSLP